MAAKVSSPLWIIVVAVAMAVILVPSGEAVKYGMCQSDCMHIQPNCSAWCKRIGYPKGGECIEPHVVDCCCWEIPPGELERTNGTAAAAGPSSSSSHAAAAAALHM